MNGPILWVDDDVFEMIPVVDHLRDSGYEVLTASSSSEARELLGQRNDIRLAVVDVMMPNRNPDAATEARGGFLTGVVLARWIRKEHPDVQIVGCSAHKDQSMERWFAENTAGYIRKPVSPHRALRYLRHLLQPDAPRWKIFIVHGHDDDAKFELKNLLNNVLKLGEPIVLHELPSRGRTVIEKFEEEAADVDLVFVLLTPDDSSRAAGSISDPRRARQNVIFELGYFFARLQRRQGRVIVLHKGELDIPSDVAGLVYIKIDGGIASAIDEIKREVGAALAAC